MFFCPVEAAKKFMAISGNFPGSLPLLRTETALLTREKLNSVLKSTLDSVVEYGVIRTHSFRAGLTTALARAGVSDDVLQSLGRWHSSAFNTYMKLGRQLRLSTQAELVSKISQMANSDWGRTSALLVV